MTDRVCFYFNSDEGCRNGGKCPFYHNRFCAYDALYQVHQVGSGCSKGDECMFIHHEDLQEGDRIVECTRPNCKRVAINEGMCKTCIVLSAQPKFCMTPDCGNQIPTRHRYCNACFTHNKHHITWNCTKCEGKHRFRERCPAEE